MKATKATVQTRVEEVAEIRIAGGGFRDIVQYASEKKWRVSERQLWNYIGRADELLATRHEEAKEKRFNLAIAQRQALYARAFEAGDWRAALSILKDRDELWGLYPSSLTELQAEVERLQRLVEEHRSNGKGKVTPRNGQTHGNGDRRDAHDGKHRTEPGRVSRDAAD